jgi:hypothetical protein
MQEQFEGGSSSGRLFIFSNAGLNRSYWASRQGTIVPTSTSPVTGMNYRKLMAHHPGGGLIDIRITARV